MYVKRCNCYYKIVINTSESYLVIRKSVFTSKCNVINFLYIHCISFFKSKEVASTNAICCIIISMLDNEYSLKNLKYTILWYKFCMNPCKVEQSCPHILEEGFRPWRSWVSVCTYVIELNLVHHPQCPYHFSVCSLYLYHFFIYSMSVYPWSF